MCSKKPFESFYIQAGGECVIIEYVQFWFLVDHWDEWISIWRSDWDPPLL